MKRDPSLWVRICAIALVAASPLAPPILRPDPARAVVFAVDRSPSVGNAGFREQQFVFDAWAERASARAGVVAFTSHAEIVAPVGAEDAPGIIAAPAGAPGTDIAAAIQLATSALPASGRRRIVLMTDGRATRGDVLEEVRRAARDGIEVDVVPVGTASSDGTAVSEVFAREPRIAQGEPAALSARVRGAPETQIQVSWARDGRDLGMTGVTLDSSGAAEVSFKDEHPDAGVHVYEARIVEGTRRAPREDVDPAAPRREAAPGSLAAVTVGGRPRAVVFTIDGDCPAVLKSALDAAEVDVQTVTITDGEPDRVALAGADLLVLADVPLAAAGAGSTIMGLSSAGQEALIEFAQKGGGVLVTGGAFGFAPEYGSSALARMLPLEIEDQGQVEDPKVAMAIMLDRSGSMGASVGTHTKIQLAVEASLAAASTLRPDDSLALGSVDEATHWNLPLGPVSVLAAERQRIRSIDAGGGGIYVFTALVDAYKALDRPIAPVRHVILFADTADSEEKEGCIDGGCASGQRSASDLAQAARRRGISTSVVGIGRESDCDTAFLRALASAGGGRFYITGDATDLRRIFVSEARVATRSNLRAGPIEVSVAGEHPALTGVDVSKMPPLGGFVESKRRATADTALVTKDDRPILSSWRYGLGKVVALTTDLRADWKDGWAASESAGQVLRQTVRYAIRRHREGGVDLRVAVHDARADVTIDVAERSGPATPGDEGAPSSIEALAIAADGSARPLATSLDRVAPGRWAMRARTSGEPFVVVRARDAQGSLVGESIGRIDGAAELSGLGPDDLALREIAREGNGWLNPSAEEAMRPGGVPAPEPVRTWPWLFVAAALLVCVDLWLRRLGRRRAVVTV